MNNSIFFIENKKFNFLFETIKSYIAGMKLTGIQVKNIKNKQIDITNSFVKIENYEAFWYGFSFFSCELKSDKPIKLLLNKREVIKLLKYSLVSGFSLVPKKIFFKNNLLKMELHIVKGKKKYHNSVGSKFKTKRIKKTLLWG